MLLTSSGIFLRPYMSVHINQNAERKMWRRRTRKGGFTLDVRRCYVLLTCFAFSYVLTCLFTLKRKTRRRKETQVNRLGFYSCVLRLAFFYINLTCGVMTVPYF